MDMAKHYITLLCDVTGQDKTGMITLLITLKICPYHPILALSFCLSLSFPTTKLASFLHPEYVDLLDCNCGLCALLLRPFFLVHGKFGRKRKQHETKAVLDSSCGVCVQMLRLEASGSYVSHHILTSWTQAEAKAILPQAWQAFNFISQQLPFLCHKMGYFIQQTAWLFLSLRMIHKLLC